MNRFIPLSVICHAAVTLDVVCVGILALLQGTILLRRSAAARRLTSERPSGDLWTLRDPPRTALSRTGSRSPQVSEEDAEPARGVPQVRDPEVVEGPTRPICPPSDPISCLPHP